MTEIPSQEEKKKEERRKKINPNLEIAPKKVLKNKGRQHIASFRRRCKILKKPHCRKNPISSELSESRLYC
ncbi:hypothetical protein Ahy_B06g082101 isoform A [Arachis hypogaea]|uniref:Uncharacterized protein n=1 Tax=Arachis hypogaea TaxID=3818 RepID=A0A444YMR4_ARAHY|nr:hypothetical protein Ahy_B06g082101 isoform A [Arachis hypogaea]